MYGPTVVINTLVDSASSLSESASLTSACSRATSRPRRSSFDWLRPAIAQRVVSGALAARYSAVSAPVKPVAPSTTTSYERSAIDLARPGERLVRRDAGLRCDPARDRGRHALRGVSGLGREVEQRLELLGGRRVGAELVGEGC